MRRFSPFGDQPGTIQSQPRGKLAVALTESLRSVLASSLAGSIVFVLALATPAYGTNVLGHVAGPDSSIRFNKINLSNNFTSAVDFNDVNNIEPTDISSIMYTNAAWGFGEVNIYDADYGNVIWQGNWSCRDWGAPGDGICDLGRVQFNQYWGPYPSQEAKSLACEEIGHSVGLDHSDGSTVPDQWFASCMSQNPAEIYLSNHDETHLQAWY